MKKLWKKLLAITTAVMMVIILLPAMANADVASGKGTVEIIKNGETESEYLSDAKFSFYKIASITNTEGNLADITNVGATATSAPSNKDNNGSTGKTELPLGVYLVKETETPENYVASKPFIVSVPSTNNYDKNNTEENAEGTSFVYDIVAQPRCL